MEGSAVLNFLWLVTTDSDHAKFDNIRRFFNDPIRIRLRTTAKTHDMHAAMNSNRIGTGRRDSVELAYFIGMRPNLISTVHV
jgi:hypothetical protein